MQEELYRHVGVSGPHCTRHEIKLVVLDHDDRRLLAALYLFGNDARELLVRRHIPFPPGTPLLHPDAWFPGRVPHIVLQEP